MPWYINFADVANRYPKVSDKGGAGSTEIDGYILGAESEVDGYLSAKYYTPFTPGSTNAPYLIRDICIDLAYWKAVGWQNEKLGPIMRASIDKRIADIVNGTIMLTNSAGMVIQGPAFAASTSDGSRSAFGVDDPTRWSVSSAEQDAYASARIGDGETGGYY